ncbi:hypothetical protein CCO03_03815 [Comamonas serinivorans]|uniref:Uncharacterized protein n=1 Tax=Comamonas serinivorans TaxID=1082851 RepID=A0A1Y0EKG7_9BURK|nr:hypothetical protein [Comamonas serinivorans]ARU03921.1 hypothetical protein CCO03_03815 [Comamonas serinivorans]
MPVHAATLVTGVIGSNTTWSAAQSPIVLQGDVVLDGNAMLSVAAGVEIRMAAQASFTLKKGAVQFSGTAANPIVVKSEAASPAPGDWGQWRFTAGTDAARTILNNTQFTHGSGLVIEGASPVLNNVAINHHSGPAISIDLTASPLGTGLSATGNTLNAIAVPAGTIRTPVIWGLVGIPYLVQHGLVEVGSAPIALEPARLKLSPGVVALVRLSLNSAAPSGGYAVDMTSSVPSVASVASRATVAQGQLGADVEIQAQIIGKTSITASHAQLGMAVAEVEVVNLPVMEIVPVAPTIGVNRPYAMSLMLPQAAPAEGLAVTLSNSDNLVLQAPSNLRMPAGKTSLDFEVTGLSDGVARLSAQADGFASALSTVTVRAKALVLPSSVIVAPGAKTPIQIALTEPAPAGGLTINLQMSSTSVATVPVSVTVPAGQSTVRADVSGVALGTAQLSVSASGYQSSQTTVRVDAIAISLEADGNMTLSIEQTLTRRVVLSKPAPAGGVTLQVSMADAGIAKVAPSEVQIPEGQIYGLSPITVTGVATGKTALTVSANGLLSKTVEVTVQAKAQFKFVIAYESSSYTKVSVGKGLVTQTNELYVQRLINGVAAGGAEAVAVNLRCVATSVCSVPATVTIPANQSYAYVPVTGVDLGSTQIEATAAGFAAGTVEAETVTPVVSFPNLDNTRTPASVRDDFRVRLQAPGAHYQQVAATALTVNLSLSDQNPAGVVTGIYTASTGGSLITQAVIAANAYQSSALYVAQPSQAGTYQVAVDIPNIVSTKSAVQTVSSAAQAFKFVIAYESSSYTKVSVGKGLVTQTNELYVQRLINGVAAGGAEAVAVNLRCVATSVCSVPATVTIPANQSYAYVPVTGVDLGSTQIEATAAGFAAGTVEAETVTPVVSFPNLDNTRTPASVRDDFRVRLQAPGAHYQQVAATALTVNLSLSDQNPAGVVTGIYTASTGGSLITQAVIAANAYQSSALYVAQPSQAGTYQVAVDIPNIVSTKSAVQTVSSAAQAFKFVIAYESSSYTKVSVGKGLVTQTNELYVQRLINGVAAGGAEAVAVNLRCVATSVCSVPATVTIPANQSYAYVPVTGVDLGSTQIEATAAGFAAGTVEAETVTPVVSFPNLDNTRTPASVRDDFRVRLQAPGAHYQQVAATALTVNLSLSDQNPAGVVTGIYTASTGGSLITQAVIAANAYQSSALYVAQPSQAGTYQVAVDIPNIVSTKSAVQTVSSAAQAFKFVIAYESSSYTKVSVGKGLVTQTNELYVQRLINGVAAGGAEAVAVNLRCVATSVCSVPATVTIPANQSYAYVPVTGVDLGSTQIEATAAGFAAGTVNVETVTPQLTFYNTPPASLAVGGSVSLRAGVSVPGGHYAPVSASALSVTATSSVPSVATMTSPISWPVNQSYSGVATLTGVAVGSTQITLSAPGFTPVTSSAITVNP